MSRGDNCSASCVTRDHETWGECVRAKALAIGYCGQGGGDATAQKQWDANLDAYRAARAQGIQPAGTDRASVERAVALSDAAGKAYQA